MHKTPKSTYELLLRTRPYCERLSTFHDHECEGRSTMEHAWTYQGRQIADAWAIVRLCAWSHLGKGLDKRLNRLLALRNAMDEDLSRYPRINWVQERIRLEAYAKNLHR